MEKAKIKVLLLIRVIIEHERSENEMEKSKDDKSIAVSKNLESSIETQACLMNVQLSHSKRELIDIEDDTRREDKRKKEDLLLDNMDLFLGQLFKVSVETESILSGNMSLFIDMFSSYRDFIEEEREKEDYYESLDDEHRKYIDEKLGLKVNECAERSQKIESLLIKFK